MRLFRRKRRPGNGDRARTQLDTSHLEEFVRTRIGVEAYVEPQTTVTETTVILIASDGEWTRRRIDAPDAAYRLGQRLGIPVYDVARVGYPQRKRDYDARQRVKRTRE
ncbi:oxidoreductase [Phytomonospora endophytica]|uniref:Uncharacterized protein n=1 Tax=Phytomonospora endophytica TaxID=714109 RepID=A0A841FRX1_9ACTN|nr:oxidoreductase [Phytomonospora endophytica]MBB6034710.1 hypothetical protein [Phytomonospora endophytica]GIG69088.1 hypothetical protein Pen01_53830 [Phytomonospora endophytica]